MDQRHRIALLVGDGFEQSDLAEAQRSFAARKASCDLISIHSGAVRAWDIRVWGRKFQVDRHVNESSQLDYTGLYIPGGLIHCDQLRSHESCLDFIKGFFNAGKLAVLVGHAPQLLASAKLCAGRRLTSSPSVRIDLENAGAIWLDAKVVVDKELITCNSALQAKSCIELIFTKGTQEVYIA